MGIDHYGDRFWRKFKPAAAAAVDPLPADEPMDTPQAAAVAVEITKPVTPMMLAPMITRAPEGPHRTRASRDH